MLDEFRKAKEPEIENLLKNAGSLPNPFAGERPVLSKALKREGIAIIAEFKRASPSRGIIRPDLQVEDAAKAYLEGGAAAISILTEENWFKGNFSYLDRAAEVLAGRLPILRKDFIFDPIQIRATAATRASAVLVIARATPTLSQISALLEEARKWRLECVVEVFNQDDLDLARQAGAAIIQVNARDLDTLKIDRQKALDLIIENQPLAHETWIFASGISEAGHLRAAWSSGFDACLIGSSLMDKPDPGLALQNLCRNSGHAS